MTGRLFVSAFLRPIFKAYAIIMKISRNYIIIYFLIITLTVTFAVLVLLYEISDPNFPEWITAISLIFVTLSIISFISNFKNLTIGDNEVRLKRLLRPDLVFSFSEIESVEELNFRYRGESHSSNVYRGHYLVIKSKDKKVKASSLNEPEYDSLRWTIKMKLGQKVTLMEKYNGNSLNWFLLAAMAIPVIYLATEIIKKIE